VIRLAIFKAADYFSLGNGIAGLIAIFLAIEMNFFWSSLFMLLAVGFDYVDGKIARLLKQGNAFGEQIDSLGDIISFGVAPAVFGYMIGMQELWQIIIMVLFVGAGMFRLARFNVSKKYIGMPITVNGVIIPVLFLVSLADGIIYYMVLAIILMMSWFRIK